MLNAISPNVAICAPGVVPDIGVCYGVVHVQYCVDVKQTTIESPADSIGSSGPAIAFRNLDSKKQNAAKLAAIIIANQTGNE